MATIYANDLVVEPDIASGGTRLYANDLVVTPAVTSAARLYGNDVVVAPALPAGSRLFANDLTVLGRNTLPLFRRDAGTLVPVDIWRRDSTALRIMSLYRRVNGQLVPVAPPAGSLLPATTVSATIRNAEILITWTGVSAATGYLVGRTGVGSNGVGPTETTEAAGARSKLFANLTNGVAYTFSVQPLPGGPVSQITATPSQAALGGVVKPLIGTAGGNVGGKFTTLNNQIGPMLTRRSYDSASSIGHASSVPTSWSGAEGATADTNAGRVVYWSFKPPIPQFMDVGTGYQARFSAFLDTIPANQKVGIIAHHEPENNMAALGGVAAWGALQNKIADLVHAKNRPNLTFGPCFMGPWTWDTRSSYYTQWNSQWEVVMDWSKFDFIGIDPYSSTPPGSGTPLERLLTVNNSGSGSGGSAPSMFGYLSKFDIPIVIAEWGRYHKEDPVPSTGRTPIPEAEVATWITDAYAWFKRWNASHPPRVESGKERGPFIKSALWYDYSILVPPADTPLTGIEITAYGQIVADSKLPSGIAPTASFSGTPVSGAAPLTVQFTDASAGNPTSFLWQFGDGTTSTLRNPIKTFTTDSTVTLTAANSYGSSVQTRVNYITVTAPETSFGTGTYGSGVYGS